MGKIKRVRKERFNTEKAFSAMMNEIHQVNSRILDLNRQNTEHLAHRIMTLESGMPSGISDEIQKELRQLSHQARETRRVIESLLHFMGVSKRFFDAKDTPESPSKS